MPDACGAILGKVLGWVLAAAAVYAALAFLAHRSVFYPMKYPAGFWHLRDRLGVEDVWLRASDGVRLHAWWRRREDSQIATLFLHGNAGNVTHRLHALEAIPAAGSSLLLLDYRGYGRSEGSPTEQGVYRDAEAGYEWLLARGYAPEQIVLHGESLGSAVAVELASRRPCRGLVLEAPFSSARAVAGRVLPLLGPTLISGFDSARRIRQVRAPILILHGDRDDIINIALGRELFAAAKEPKTFWEVPGAGHNDLPAAAGLEYEQRLAAFYAGGR